MARSLARRWTFLTPGRGRREHATWTLDLDSYRLSSNLGRSAALTQKGVAFLCLLLQAFGDRTADSRMGWVSAEDVAELPAWTGQRTTTSLVAQIRREVKAIEHVIPAFVETPARARVRGPWRVNPESVVRVRSPLPERPEGRPATADHSGDATPLLFSWLEGAEPVWRSLHYFDKQGEAMSNLPRLQAATTRDPLTTTLVLLSAARRLREHGRQAAAARALASAEQAARHEPHVPVRGQLLGLCAIQRAWLAYRRGDLDGTERWLGAADHLARSAGALKLRGPILNLRSLVQRSRGNLGAALQDLRAAARLFLLDGDLFHLFAVYHNLACLVSVQADGEPDPDRRDALYRQALLYSERNHAYCRRYGVGHNSTLNKLLQVGLHRRLGQLDEALRIAGDAERIALDSQNFPDALKAHQHRVEIWLQTGQLALARRHAAAITSTLTDTAYRRKFAAVLADQMSASLDSKLVATREGTAQDRVPLQGRAGFESDPPTAKTLRA